MQRIRLNRGLLTELDRCDKSFVMSLFWHGLDNDSLLQKGGVSADSSNVYEVRREMMYNCHSLARSIAEAGGVTEIVCDTTDIQEKVDLTWDAIVSGDKVVIADGALEGSNFIVPFAVLFVRDDGMWEVYHQSTKSYDISNAKLYHKALNSMYKDAAPLMHVLAEDYAANVARFAVVAANKRYLSPYPDPQTGELIVDPNEAMYCVDLDIFNESIADFLGGEDPLDKVYELQSELSANPFWIPEADMGSQCRNPYDCPYLEYCEREKRTGSPTSVYFYMSSNDRKKLETNGYYTMDDVLELSYDYPTLMDIPTIDGEDTFDISEVGLRTVRSYEESLLDVEDEVNRFLN